MKKVHFLQKCEQKTSFVTSNSFRGFYIGQFKSERGKNEKREGEESRDYVLYLKAKGIRKSRIFIVHMIRNILPLLII